MRNQWEAKAIEGQQRDAIASKRHAERREAFASYDGLERRTAERRAVLDSARVAHWIARFDNCRACR